MMTVSSDAYISHIDWFNDAIDEDVIIAFKSALECLGYFQGWIGEETIDVYSTHQGKYDNIHYHIIDNINDIETEYVNGFRCTTFNQTLNDMLSHINDIDEQPIIESLSAYYFEHNESYAGLKINPDNCATFSRLLDEALEYYDD